MGGIWFVIKSFLLGYSLRDMAIAAEQRIIHDLSVKLVYGREMTEREEMVLKDIIQNSRFPETRKELDRLQVILENSHG